MSFLGGLNNLAVTVTSGAMASATGKAMDFLQSGLLGRYELWKGGHCRYYYSGVSGGSILQVATKGVVDGTVAELKSLAVNKAKEWIFGKPKVIEHKNPKSKDETEAVKKERKEYGKLLVKNEKKEDAAIYALDDWGERCVDALMLGIPSEKPITITQQYLDFVSDGKDGKLPKNIEETVKSDTLVWYDTSAIITINSDKNLISTKVQGRDYSRKELVSNGDIKFTVSGQITSKLADIYPAFEVQKFLKIMRYKGVVRLNNQLLDQLGITHIVITDFSMPQKEGYKSVQSYTFSGLGLQPESERQIDDKDTIKMYPVEVATKKKDGIWKNMLKGQLEGLKREGADILDNLTAQSTGLLSGLL